MRMAISWNSICRIGLQAAPGLILLVILLCLPLGVEDFALLEVTHWSIYGLLALSLTFVWGVGGIFSFGQTIFFGLGGYTYGVASLNLPGASGTVLGLLAGVAIAVLAAALLGYFIFYGRVGQLYVGIATLACTLILYHLFSSMAGDQYRIGQVAIGGFNGMQRVPTLLDLAIVPHYLFVVVVATLTLGGLWWVTLCRFGRVFNAVRVNEERTELLGYDVRAVKVIGFTIGAAIAGLAGVLHTSWGNTINPSVFGLSQATLVAILVMVGGRSKLWGAFLGAALIQFLSGFLGTFAQEATPLILGATMIAVVLLLPEGMAPALQSLWQYLSGWKFRPEIPLLADADRLNPTRDTDKYKYNYDILEVQGLKYRFGHFWAVNNINLKFQAGQAYCVIGPNGAGKSTFFNLLTGRLAPTEGHIFYDTQEITHLMPHERARRGISIKLQTPNVYRELSVWENLWLAAAIRYPTATQRQIQMARIVKEIGLCDSLGKRAGELSYGEQQWLEIGMAAMPNPLLMLLDEPTGGMSRGETLRTVELVKQLAQRSTVIAIEHNMEFVRQLGANVTVFYHGEVFTQGTAATLQQDKRVIEIYLGRTDAEP